jgi:uncharacterized membrane protein
MLGAFEGAIADFLSALSSIVASNKHKSFIARNMVAIVIVINLLILLAGLATYKNIFSLFAVAGALLQTDALWITDEKKIRIVSFLGAPFWLIYNFLSRAYGSAIGDILSMCSIIIAMVRHKNSDNEKVLNN